MTQSVTQALETVEIDETERLHNKVRVEAMRLFQAWTPKRDKPRHLLSAGETMARAFRGHGLPHVEEQVGIRLAMAGLFGGARS